MSHIINLDLIKPDGSGKFSPNLHKWMRKSRNVEFHRRQVFQTGSFEDRSVFSDQWRPNEIIVGLYDPSDGGMSGNSLGSIIRGDRGVFSSSFYYTRGFNLREITDEFWDLYLKIGQCAWDRSHQMYMQNDENRYQYSEDGLRRTCCWCGETFLGTKKQRIDVREYIEWDAVHAAEVAK